MSLVVLLKGVNVGGHRTFRPSVLAEELRHLDVVNVGAAGTFVVRGRVGRTDLRAEVARRLPFEAHVVICSGSDLLRLVAGDPFAAHPSSPGVVRFVSVMARRPSPPPSLPPRLPGDGPWGLRVLACQGRFIVGLHRRQMKAIAYLGQLEKALGAPLTTRSWSTVLAIAGILRR